MPSRAVPEANKNTFVCQRCTACCRWPGEVRLNDVEIASIAAFRRMTESEFIQRYTRINRFRHGLALEEKADGTCIFLEGKDCAIQSVKPRQCREFPNGWKIPGFKDMCQSQQAS